MGFTMMPTPYRLATLAFALAAALACGELRAGEPCELIDADAASENAGGIGSSTALFGESGG